jgi:site-specific recombinase XerD
VNDLIREFSLYLASEGKKPRTITIYTDAAKWIQKAQGITEWAQITRSDVRRHMAFLNEKYSPGYASNQYRALAVFFRFLSEEENIPSPMSGIRPPKVPEKLVPVIAKSEYADLIHTCSGKSFTDIRDRALIEFFRSTGARRSEVSELKVSDVDLDQLAAIVTGKASRMRVVRFDSSAGLAISRYLRARKNHRHSSSPMLWIGTDGPLQSNAIYLMFKRRGEKAGVKINPHRFRHDFSHRYLYNGGQETDLMQQNGWSSSSMLRRYGASAAAQRAREHYDQVMT